jgi:hypothetical protein
MKSRFETDGLQAVLTTRPKIRAEKLPICIGARLEAVPRRRRSHFSEVPAGEGARATSRMSEGKMPSRQPARRRRYNGFSAACSRVPQVTMHPASPAAAWFRVFQQTVSSLREFAGSP